MGEYMSCFLLIFVIYLDYKNILFRRRAVKRFFAIILLILYQISSFLSRNSVLEYHPRRYIYDFE